MSVFAFRWWWASHHELRGWAKRSRDGRTYLVVDDVNGGKCGRITVDGMVWLHPIHEPGEITPGVHRIDCGGASGIAFEVRNGMVFHFDYWGP